jgi:hypothetical protein
MTVRYQHDCEDCNYVGDYGKYDLYVHDDEHQRSVIAREGSEGWDYSSWPMDVVDEAMATGRFVESNFRYFTALARHRLVKTGRWEISGGVATPTWDAMLGVSAGS